MKVLQDLVEGLKSLQDEEFLANLQRRAEDYKIVRYDGELFAVFASPEHLQYFMCHHDCFDEYPTCYLDQDSYAVLLCQSYLQ